MADNGYFGGISDEEAQEFMSYYLLGTIVFVVVAIIAHFLVWQWRPWIPGPEGYTSLIDSGSAIANFITSKLA